MKIAQLMLSKGFGGAERYFLDLVRCLARDGHEVLAICHQRSACAEALQNEPGVALRTVRLLGLWDVFGVRAIGRVLREFAPELIHAHLSRGAAIAGRITRGQGPPLVNNLHNYIKLKRYRHIDLFIACTRRQQQFLQQVLAQPGAARVSSGAPVSSADAEARKGVPGKMAEGTTGRELHGGAPATGAEDPGKADALGGRMVLIPNFSSLAPIAAVPAPAQGAVRFLAYGRMVEKKGFPELVRAFAQLRSQGLDAQLTLGGDGPERGRIEALGRELGVAERIEFPGWIEDVTPALARAEVFVLPSRLEPFGIVVLEAMARGVAIVTTRTEGPSEVLDMDSAWFADIGDSASLAKAMQVAASEPEQRVQKAQKALHLYRTSYHDSVVVPRIVNAYQDVLQRRARITHGKQGTTQNQSSAYQAQD